MKNRAVSLRAPKGRSNLKKQKEVNMYYVYIMSNFTNSVIYIGVTNNLIRRVYEHKEKLVEGFTKKYNINKLVYYECTNDVYSAISREKQLKNLSRANKNKLIEVNNKDWEDLWNKIVQ